MDEVCTVILSQIWNNGERSKNSWQKQNRLTGKRVGPGDSMSSMVIWNPRRRFVRCSTLVWEPHKRLHLTVRYVTFTLSWSQVFYNEFKLFELVQSENVVLRGSNGCQFGSVYITSNSYSYSLDAFVFDLLSVHCQVFIAICVGPISEENEEFLHIILKRKLNRVESTLKCTETHSSITQLVVRSTVGSPGRANAMNRWTEKNTCLSLPWDLMWHIRMCAHACYFSLFLCSRFSSAQFS